MTGHSHQNPPVGFIGAGRMGAGIAHNLLRKGFRLTLLPGPTGANIAGLVREGAALARSAKEMAEACPIVLTCLPSSAVTADIVNGPAGLLSVAAPGFLHVDLTSGDPRISAQLHAQYRDKGAHFADIALAGTPETAASGELVLMAGGEGPILDRLEPILSGFSRRIVHVGGPGAGHSIKVIMSFLGMAMANASAEALATASRAGIDLEALRSLIGETGMNSQTFQAMALTALDGDESRRKLTIAQARKDVQALVAMTQEQKLDVRIAPATLASLDAAAATGHGNNFVPALTRLLLERLISPARPRSPESQPWRGPR